MIGTNKNEGNFYPDFKSDEIGYSVRQNNGRILIMIEIYKKKDTKKILNEMVVVKNKIIEEMLLRTGEDVIVSMVDAKEIIEQVDRYNNVNNDVCIEVIDLLNGDFIPVELTVKK